MTTAMGRKIALLIGNSEFDDESFSHLIAPSVDVASLATLLLDPRIGGFDDVTTLINESRNIVAERIESVLSDRSRTDLILLYFSGHGLRSDVDGRLYLATKDTARRKFRSTGINAAFITELMDQCRSRSIILILDCCHSGAFSQGMKGGAIGESAGTRSTFQGTGQGRVVLSASDATQYAWEGDKLLGANQNSVFTHYLIEGLGTGAADENGDGIIGIDELFEYARREVQARSGRQNPQMWTYKGEGRIEVARSIAPNDRRIVRALSSKERLAANIQRRARYFHFFLEIHLFRHIVALKRASSLISIVSIIACIGVVVWLYTLPSGHMIVIDGRTDYSNSGFVFRSGSRVSWDSGKADLCVSNEPDRSREFAQLFIQYFAAPYAEARYDINAFGGIQKMATKYLSEVREAPVQGYIDHYVTPKVGEVYCVRTRDGGHFAKIQITDVEKTKIGFDWIYQPLPIRRFR